MGEILLVKTNTIDHWILLAGKKSVKVLGNCVCQIHMDCLKKKGNKNKSYALKMKVLSSQIQNKALWFS